MPACFITAAAPGVAELLFVDLRGGGAGAGSDGDDDANRSCHGQRPFEAVRVAADDGCRSRRLIACHHRCAARYLQGRKDLNVELLNLRQASADDRVANTRLHLHRHFE